MVGCLPHAALRAPTTCNPFACLSRRVFAAPSSPQSGTNYSWPWATGHRWYPSPPCPPTQHLHVSLAPPHPPPDPLQSNVTQDCASGEPVIWPTLRGMRMFGWTAPVAGGRVEIGPYDPIPLAPTQVRGRGGTVGAGCG